MSTTDLGAARLADHRLAFTRRSVKTGTGVADIVPAPGETVWGALYELGDGELAAIDRKEDSAGLTLKMRSAAPPAALMKGGYASNAGDVEVIGRDRLNVGHCAAGAAGALADPR
jgi:hypothetical protein